MATSKRNLKKEEEIPDDGNSSFKGELAEIQQALEAENPEIFKNVPIGQKMEIIKTMVSYKQHSGPLPSAETLKSYNELIPDAAERLFADFELQSLHRRKLEAYVIPSQVKQSGRGQVFGFILAVILIGASVYLGISGHDILAGVLGGATILGLASIFVLNKETSQRKSGD